MGVAIAEACEVAGIGANQRAGSGLSDNVEVSGQDGRSALDMPVAKWWFRGSGEVWLAKATEPRSSITLSLRGIARFAQKLSAGAPNAK